ncbi:hypothetical protein PVAP13_7NG041117 [Panicum virgatum]|uniref:Uncharacterized protein n=1 Tax=Panicum virgatum TaxID=38727 RepID=A0A8T0PWG6_PANVG|nr:hypothetical protein PVAP13_7NG041117 [Panicum virgatum]
MENDSTKTNNFFSPGHSIRKVYPATGRASNPTRDPRSPAGRREPRLPFSACFDRPTPLSPSVPQTPPPPAHPNGCLLRRGARAAVRILVAGEERQQRTGRRGAAAEGRRGATAVAPSRSGGSGSGSLAPLRIQCELQPPSSPPPPPPPPSHPCLALPRHGAAAELAQEAQEVEGAPAPRAIAPPIVGFAVEVEGGLALPPAIAAGPPVPPSCKGRCQSCGGSTACCRGRRGSVPLPRIAASTRTPPAVQVCSEVAGPAACCRGRRGSPLPPPFASSTRTPLQHRNPSTPWRKHCFGAAPMPLFLPLAAAMGESCIFFSVKLCEFFARK